MSRFKMGDKLIPATKGRKILLADSKVKIQQSLKQTGRPYLIVDYIRSFDSWIVFSEQPMRQSSHGGEPNAWNPDYWEHYIEPNHLDEDLFKL